MSTPERNTATEGSEPWYALAFAFIKDFIDFSKLTTFEKVWHFVVICLVSSFLLVFLIFFLDTTLKIVREAIDWARALRLAIMKNIVGMPALCQAPTLAQRKPENRCSAVKKDANGNVVKDKEGNIVKITCPNKAGVDMFNYRCSTNAEICCMCGDPEAVCPRSKSNFDNAVDTVLRLAKGPLGVLAVFLYFGGGGMVIGVVKLILNRFYKNPINQRELLQDSELYDEAKQLQESEVLTEDDMRKVVQEKVRIQKSENVEEANDDLRERVEDLQNKRAEAQKAAEAAKEAEVKVSEARDGGDAEEIDEAEEARDAAVEDAQIAEGEATKAAEAIGEGGII